MHSFNVVLREMRKVQNTTRVFHLIEQSIYCTDVRSVVEYDDKFKFNDENTKLSKAALSTDDVVRYRS
jgi:hypothetical protein